MASQRVLLIQCCHPAQLAYVALRLREQHPDWIIEALALDTPMNRARFAAGSYFDAVHYSEEELVDAPPDLIILPLLNRGYLAMVRLALRLKKPVQQCGYDCRLRRLSRSALLKRWLRPPPPAAEFVQFHRTFPLVPLGRRVLVVQSSAGLPEASRHRWERHLPPDAQLTRVARGSLWRNWRALRKREFDGAVTFFGADPGYNLLRLLPFLLGIRRTVVVDEIGETSVDQPRTLARLLLNRIVHPRPVPPLQPLVLFVQTESVPYLVHAVRKLRESGSCAEAEVVVVCRHRDRAELEKELSGCRFISRPERSLKSGLWLWNQARRLKPDAAYALFTGRGVFRKYKLLFFTLNVRNRIAFNAGLEYYPLKLRSLPRVFRKEPLLFDQPGLRPDAVLLLIQTDDDTRMRQVLRRLEDPRIAGRASIEVFCSPEKRQLFESLPSVSRVITYRKGGHKSNFKTFLQLRRLRPDVVAALLAGRPTFRQAKLLFFLLPARHRLVFNAHLECYYLSRKTWRHLFKREGAAGGAGGVAHRLLLIQTEDDPTMIESLSTVRSPDVARVAQLFVYCRQDKSKLFEARPEVASTVTYRKGALRENLRNVWRLRSLDLDSVAAVFSGRPIFRLQKLLFFLAPARHRLVINENQDCFYFTWRRGGQFLRLHKYRLEPFVAPLLRVTAKGLLFLPRFFYLVIWVTFMKLRRAYSLNLEDAPGRD